MAGEIAGVNYNPYNAMNDDFLASLYFNKMAQQSGASQQTGQTGASNPAFQGNSGAQGDTFQRSSSLMPALAAGTLGGGAAAAAGYYFAKPVNKNGEVAEGLIKALDKANHKEFVKGATEEILENLKSPTFAALDIPDQKTYDVIKKFATSGKLDDLTDAEKALLPDKYKVQADARSAVTLAEEEFKKIDMKKVAQDAEKAANELSLEYNRKHLQQLKVLQGKVNALSDNISEADLEKFIKENKAAFHFEGTEDEIAKEIKEIAKDGKASLKSNLDVAVNGQDEYVKGIRKGIKEGIMDNYDTEAKAFIKDAPETLKNAVKNFKWKQAGIWGAIAGGTILALSALFGGGGSKPAPKA